MQTIQVHFKLTNVAVFRVPNHPDLPRTVSLFITESPVSWETSHSPANQDGQSVALVFVENAKNEETTFQWS